MVQPTLSVQSVNDHLEDLRREVAHARQRRTLPATPGLLSRLLARLKRPVRPHGRVQPS